MIIFLFLFLHIIHNIQNKLPNDIHNGLPVMSLRKQLKTHYFDIFSRPPDGCAMSCPEVCYVLTLPDMWILTLIIVSEFLSHIWSRVHEIGKHEIKVYKINLVFIYLYCVNNVWIILIIE